MPSRDDQLDPLLRRIAVGDHDAMHELFQRERSALMRLFYGLTRSGASADDMLQNTFLALWRYRHNYRGSGSATAYLYRVAVNQWRRNHSREKRGKEVFEDYAPMKAGDLVTHPEHRLEREETKAAVWQAIGELPSAQRETFVLHRFEGMSCPQIADTIDKPVKTVESRLRLALEKLTEKLQKREKSR